LFFSVSSVRSPSNTVKIEAKNIANVWYTIVSTTALGGRGSQYFEIPDTFNYLKGVRFTFDATAGTGALQLGHFSWFPYSPRPDNGELPTHPKTFGANRVIGSLAVSDRNGASVTTIGPGTLRINTGATLNWQSPVTTVTLTGEATQLITVAVPGATGIFVEATNARITGEVTGTGANNVTIHNPALLTGSVSLVLERYV
jgi:hypothetical protein